MIPQPRALIKPNSGRAALSGRKSFISLRNKRNSRQFYSIGACKIYPPTPLSELSKPKNQSVSSSAVDAASNNYKVLKFRILSNWGHPALVACNDISLLDESKQKIEIDMITAYPKDIENVNLLYRSSNTAALCTPEALEADDCLWIAPIDPKRPIELTIITTDPRKVCFIRITISSKYDTMNIKEIQVFDGLDVLYQGIVDKDIGAVIPLAVSERMELQHYKKYIASPSSVRLMLMHRDKYGIVPQFTGEKLSVEFLSNYGNPNSMSMSHLVFYDADLKVINSSSFKVTARRGVPTNRLDSCIFNDSLTLQSMSNQISFQNSEDTNPMIDITVKESIVIGGVCLYNTCVTELPMNMCVSKFKIYVNDILAFVGLLKIGGGDPIHQNHCMINVSLSDLNKNLAIYD
jgi:hypothetical protein